MFTSAQLDSFSDRHVVGVLPFALVLAPAPVAALMNVWRSRARLSGDYAAAGKPSRGDNARYAPGVIRAAIGIRQPVPKARSVTFNPGAACLRLNSAVRTR